MPDGIAHAALYGADHEALDRIAERAVGTRAAIALTRGRHQKAYRYEDPNEDAVAAVAGPASTLLVAADGHHGRLASHRAVAALVDLVGPPPAQIADREWLELFGAVNDAILAEKGVVSLQAASETVLVAALIAGDRVSFAAVGDATLVVGGAHPARAGQANKVNQVYLGRRMSQRALKRAVHRGQTGVGDGDWVILVTDGLSEFVAPSTPADVLPRILAGAGPHAAPEAAARAIAEAAGAAGAGDNVGVALTAPA